MKVIDLLNKIANGEEVPKEVEYNGLILHYNYELNDYCCDYEDDEGELHGEYLFTSSFDKNIAKNLNDEVEILEEEKKTKPLTKKDIEALGYACGEIQKCFTNGWTKSLENKPLEEEKEIPERLKEYIHTDSLNYNQCNYMFEKLTNKYNEIIDYLDYLKSKGDE